MKILNEAAVLGCVHAPPGIVKNKTTQEWVTINRRAILVEINPEARPISGCPNIGATIKPCTLTLKAFDGYSSFIRIGGKRVCLDTVTGLTDGTPPGTVEDDGKRPGQDFVEATA